MISRTIDLDPFADTIEEKIFRNAKRLCVIFAIGAVSLSALDIANIRTVENAAALVRGSNLSVASLPDTLRAGIERISFMSDEPSAVAVIPSVNFNVASRPMGNAMPPIEKAVAVRSQQSQVSKSQTRMDASPVSHGSSE